VKRLTATDDHCTYTDRHCHDTRYPDEATTRTSISDSAHKGLPAGLAARAIITVSNLGRNDSTFEQN